VATTFRLTLTSEEDPSLILLDRPGIPEALVREIANVLRDVLPMAQAARGVHQAYRGIADAFNGLAEMGAPAKPHRRHRTATRGRR
jgi:hypothetical protein